MRPALLAWRLAAIAMRSDLERRSKWAAEDTHTPHLDLLLGTPRAPPHSHYQQYGTPRPPIGRTAAAGLLGGLSTRPDAPSPRQPYRLDSSAYI